MFHILNNLLIPASCALCDSTSITEMDLCVDCLAMLPANDHCCKACAQPLIAVENTLLCGDCIDRKQRFASAIVPFLYRPPIDYMVKRLKFSGDLKFSRIVGQLLTRAASQWPSPDALIPVPLHPNRFAERGFNQAELLAQHVAKSRPIPILQGAASRLKDQPAQSRLTATQREINLQGAFQANLPLTDKHIAIIDDVVTTGATARALAKQLRKAGAKKISLWAVARTP